jgi:hypothetical protein
MSKYKIPKLSVRLKYFLIAIIGFGSIGIWLPFVLAIPLGKEVPFSSVSINSTTFYVSILFAGCVEYILNLFDKPELTTHKSHALNVIAMLIFGFVLTISIIWLYVEDILFWSTVLAFLGVLISLRLWWVNNSNNPTLNEVIRKEANDKHGEKW